MTRFLAYYICCYLGIGQIDTLQLGNDESADKLIYNAQCVKAELIGITILSSARIQHLSENLW